MEIQSVKDDGINYILNDVIFVPKNEENSDYQKIQKWIATGGIVDQGNLLTKVKLEKITKVKSLRDQKNIEPINDYQGLVIDAEGNVTEQESYFVFYTNRHQTNPASDPDSIISRVLDLGAIPYFTEDPDGNKIAIQLTTDLVTLLRQRIAERNNNNYRLTSLIEIEINNAQTLEEVEAISLES